MISEEGERADIGAATLLGTSVTPQSNVLALLRETGVRERSSRRGGIVGGAPVLPLSLVGFLTLVAAFDATAFRLLIPDIHRSLGLGIGLLTALATVPMLLLTILAPVLGFVVDRTTRVTLQALGALVAHASIALGGVAPSASVFIGAKVLGTGGSMASSPTGFSLLSDYYPPVTRGRVFSILGFTGVLGAIAAPIVVGAAASGLGWRLTLVLIGVVASAGGLSLFLLQEPVRGMQDRVAIGIDHDSASLEQPPLGWRESWRAAWSIRTVRRFAFAQPFLTVSSTAAVLVVIYYEQRFHLSTFRLGLVVTIAYCPALLGCLAAGWITDRFMLWRPGAVMKLLAGVWVAVGISFLVIVNTPVLALAVGFHGLISLVAALPGPAMQTTLSLALPARMRGFGGAPMAPFMLIGLVVSLALSAFAQVATVAAGVIACVPILLVGAAIMFTTASTVEEDIRTALEQSAGGVHGDEP